MKSGEEIVDYIDDFVSNCLESPRLYALSPLALEEVLFQVDMIRKFATDDSLTAGQPFLPDYSKYLTDKGFGSATFVVKKTWLSDYKGTEESLFAELVDFWRDYISQRDKYR